MQNRKYYIYPIFILLITFVLALLNIHGSSIGIYNEKLFNNTQETSLLFGTYRAIRSDEYLVGTPMLISQALNKNPIINQDMGEGNNSGMNDFPSNSFFSLFRPQSWIFFLSNNLEFSFSFYWLIRLALFLISTYLLILELTKKNLFLAISGSLLLFFTPFVQWWLPISIFYTISFGIFFFLRLIKERKLIKQILYGIGLTYWVISFAIILYPPFQIPLMYAAIFIGIGVLLEKKKDVFFNKENLKRLLLIFSGVVVITISFLLLFFYQFKDIIEITANTVYPGARFISAGQGSLYQLLSGFYNILMQKDSNGAPFANQSEASNFFLLYLPLVIWVIYKNIILFIKKKNIDWIAISISLCLIFFTAFYFLPLPDILSKYTGMYMVPPSRMWIGIGFMNYILIFYLLSKNIYNIKQSKILDWILSITLLVFTGLLMYQTGKYLYNLNPVSFEWPTIISPNIKILLVTVFVPTLLGLLLLGYKKIFLSLLLLFAILSTIYINPLYKGLDILTNTELANYITEVSEKDDSKWIAYDNNMLAQYALANNASIINGIHLYPQFKIWEILDPEKEYIDIYNRYAHINISEYEEGEEYIRLLYPDSLEVNISPCDKKWDSLNVKYIITHQDMNYSCLELQKDFSEYGIKIYTREIVLTHP